jgi:hypothetical protein
MLPKQTKQHVSVAVRMVMMFKIISLNDAFIVKKIVTIKTNYTTTTEIITRTMRSRIIKDAHLTIATK